MSVKSDLRKEFKLARSAVKNKSAKDTQIAKALINSDVYQNAELVLFYASFGDEVGTDICIADALDKGKKIALPVCTDKSGNMKFYYITSLSQTVEGAYSIREPDTALCREVEDFSSSICIVPAIAFDKQGYRLGYGGGYYDRFLKNYTSIFVGLCYNEMIVESLPVEKYDRAVDFLVCEKGIYAVRQGGSK